MADGTKIEWTDATWNPITGCQIKSAGCANCYAMALAGTRLKNHPTRAGLTRENAAGKPVWNGEVRFNDKALLETLRWTRPRMIFVCAHADLFYEAVPDEWIDRVFAVMALCPQHTFQVLTKRPERMREYLGSPAAVRRIYDLVCDMVLDLRLPVALIARPEHETMAPPGPRVRLDAWPLPHVWLGTSVEDQATADERIPLLLDTPAELRWISAEPLLGPVGIYHHLTPIIVLGGADVPTLDWVVVGGESGKHARPMHPAWARSLRDQCAAAGVRFLFKQWGEWQQHTPTAGGDLGGDIRADRVRIVHAAKHSDAELCRRSFFEGDVWMKRVGKSAAGRLLDGVDHNNFPEMPA